MDIDFESLVDTGKDLYSSYQEGQRPRETRPASNNNQPVPATTQPFNWKPVYIIGGAVVALVVAFFIFKRK